MASCYARETRSRSQPDEWKDFAAESIRSAPMAQQPAFLSVSSGGRHR